MGTQGYVIFKYESIYYIFYNHSDSCFEKLGNLVIDEINKMINKNTVRYYKNLLLSIPLKRNDEGNKYVQDFYSILKYPESYQYFTSDEEQYNEYTYTIDFDNNKFIANKYGKHIYSFNLNDIPLDWYEITQNNSSYEEDNSEDDNSEDDKETILNKIKELEQTINKLKLKLK